MMNRVLEIYVTWVTIPLLAGVVLDLLLGDPGWLRPHPVVLIGKLISTLERFFLGRGDVEPVERKRLLAAGMVTFLLTGAAAFCIPAIVLYGIHRLPGSVAGVVASLLCWMMLAGRSLSVESRKVYGALQEKDLDCARKAVGRIVGRDTGSLDEEGVIRAAVETVAENTSDGVTAPMISMALLGVPGLWFYKAVNTMDSMIGYKTGRYLYFGRTAARMDDVINWIPSRLTALAMVAAAAILPGLHGRQAWTVWRRDRRKHPSPNSAQTESACAGALGIRLAGPMSYFGEIHRKPFLGDPLRAPEPEDILRAGRLMYLSSFLILLVTAGIPLVMAFFL